MNKIFNTRKVILLLVLFVASCATAPATPAAPPPAVTEAPTQDFQSVVTTAAAEMNLAPTDNPAADTSNTIIARDDSSAIVFLRREEKGVENVTVANGITSLTMYFNYRGIAGWYVMTLPEEIYMIELISFDDSGIPFIRYCVTAPCLAVSWQGWTQLELHPDTDMKHYASLIESGSIQFPDTTSGVFELAQMNFTD